MIRTIFILFFILLAGSACKIKQLDVPNYGDDNPEPNKKQGQKTQKDSNGQKREPEFGDFKKKKENIEKDFKQKQEQEKLRQEKLDKEEEVLKQEKRRQEEKKEEEELKKSKEEEEKLKKKFQEATKKQARDQEDLLKKEKLSREQDNKKFTEDLEAIKKRKEFRKQKSEERTELDEKINALNLKKFEAELTSDEEKELEHLGNMQELYNKIDAEKDIDTIAGIFADSVEDIDKITDLNGNNILHKIFSNYNDKISTDTIVKLIKKAPNLLKNKNIYGQAPYETDEFKKMIKESKKTLDHVTEELKKDNMNDAYKVLTDAIKKASS